MSTWDPTRTLSTLTNGNLTSTTGTGSNYQNSFSTSTRADKRVFSAILGTVGVNDDIAVGVANASASVGGGPFNWIGSDINSIAMFDLGEVMFNNAQIGATGLIPTTGDFMVVAVDAIAQLIWFRLNGIGNWNGNPASDPATGASGFSFAGLGQVVFAACTGRNEDNIVANFSPNLTAPTGFTLWDLLPAAPFRGAPSNFSYRSVMVGV